MASQLDTLKNTVMTTINGGNPAAALIQQAQNAIKSALAEAKHIAEMTTIVTPQQTTLTNEIADLNSQKSGKSALLKSKEAEAEALDKAIETQTNELKQVQDTEAKAKKEHIKQSAKAKAQGRPVPEAGDNKARKLKESLDEQKKKRDDLYKEIDSINGELSNIDDQIQEKQKTFDLLTAQLSPEAALTAAQEKTALAQSKIENANTPEALQIAQKELEEAEQNESELQTISDDHDKAVENKESANEPKMMQLQAEYQVMDAGVKTIQYLTINIPIFFTSASVSVGANGGGPVPMLPTVSLTLGNLLYGYGFFVLATVKAAAVRFLALAQELEYSPTTEMAIIDMIAPVEVEFKSAMAALAPAGAALI